MTTTRLRNMRRMGLSVERRRRGDMAAGLHEYRLLAREAVQCR